jgi:AraC-like DNA-binding protein
LAELRASLPVRLRDGTASLPILARALAMSTRTLQRRLAGAGTSWRAELEAARRELATALSAEGLPSEAIATQLGYSDARALRRAVQRWRADGESITQSCAPSPSMSRSTPGTPAHWARFR